MTDPNWINHGQGGQTVTPLERHADALAATIIAATYPSDTIARQCASEALACIDISYVDAIARIIEGLAKGPTPQHIEPDEARWRLVEFLCGQVGQLRERGAITRDGILRTGLPAGPLGLGLIGQEDDGDE